MVTQSEDKKNKKVMKKRNKIINEEIVYLHKKLQAIGPDHAPTIVHEAYHLGMDTGIKIGREEL